MYCLQTRALRHRFSNGQRVLDGIDLRVREGGIYGFLGPNGAGKTTTLRLLLGLLRQQEGEISIFGKALARHRIEILRKVGALIESPSLYAHLSAAENLALAARIHRVANARVIEALGQVGLAGVGRKPAGQFSLGMKQRLGIALALLHRPSLLILDEPTNGLDPNGSVEIRELLLRLNRESGVTLLVSSHLLAEMEKLVVDVGVIRDGRLVYQGTLDDLKKRQRSAAPTHLATDDDARALALLSRAAVAAERTPAGIRLPALADAHVADINRRLVAAGIGVHAIGARADDLETVFMDLLAERAA